MSKRLFVIVRSLLVSSLFVSLWLWFVPRWIAASKDVVLSPDRTWAIAIMLLGAPFALRCIWDFAWSGEGTPAPFDPPRRLVVSGLYRWVRNPMYLSFGVVFVGEALLFPSVTREMLIVAPLAWLFFTAFVMLYEEPKLRELFGDEYEEYRRNVRRWLPRVRPYAAR
ncbi:MAG TPA: isoprenylcysteine carboxylmethyltransferase family protein [Thermoanaerobaculia bacterium]|nr:isoprenylcysteine carboxylmethyltransferase family protein [Thermoanaerobaculia bacterium]